MCYLCWCRFVLFNCLYYNDGACFCPIHKSKRLLLFFPIAPQSVSKRTRLFTVSLIIVFSTVNPKYGTLISLYPHIENKRLYGKHLINVSFLLSPARKNIGSVTPARFQVFPVRRIPLMLQTYMALSSSPFTGT